MLRLKEYIHCATQTEGHLPSWSEMEWRIRVLARFESDRTAHDDKESHLAIRDQSAAFRTLEEDEEVLKATPACMDSLC